MIGRLRGRRDIEHLRARGLSARGRYVAVRHAPGLQGIRVAYAIPRQVGSAVRRNRIRRQLRAAVEMMDRDNDARLAEGDYLVRALPSAVGEPYAALRDDLGDVLAELRGRPVT